MLGCLLAPVLLLVSLFVIVAVVAADPALGIVVLVALVSVLRLLWPRA